MLGCYEKEKLDDVNQAEKVWENFKAEYETRIHHLIDRKDS